MKPEFKDSPDKIQRYLNDNFKTGNNIDYEDFDNNGLIKRFKIAVLLFLLIPIIGILIRLF